MGKGSNTDASLIDAVVERAHAKRELLLYAMSHKREFPPEWYDWQLESFSAPEPQTMLMAGNQTGKTWSAAYHFACDITGDYPKDWDGFKFEHQLDTTVLGVENTQLKDVTQAALFGELDPKSRRFSGGWVHADEIQHVDPSQTRGLAKTVYVRSKFGTSKVQLRAYTQSMTGQATLSFAGTKKDLIWADECPPDELVGQLVMRTANGNRGKGGRIRYTMTPELGMTGLVTQFMENRKAGQRLIGPVAWSDCPHITAEKRELLLAGIPEHEHEMREMGTPFFGSGLVFPIAESRIKVEPFDFSGRGWWKCIRAIDIGIDHPTALVWLVYDPEEDVIYLVKDYAVSGEPVAVHAAAANGYMSHAPLVFPHDADQREKGSGKTVRHYYENAGIKNGVDFENEDGSKFVEPGIMEMLDRMRNGKFKVFSSCQHFFREMRTFHRKDGKIIFEGDDVIQATRYGAIMIPRYGTGLQARTRKPNVIRARA